MRLNHFLYLIVFALLQYQCSHPVEISNNNDWYEFEPENNHNQPSLIGLEDWNNEPAGMHGHIVSNGEKLIYNGQEIKLWGLNNCYGFCSPSKEKADEHAVFYRKFGVNALRLHKYADNTGDLGIQSQNSFVEFDPKRLDRMDYYISSLKNNGIYVKLSPTFGVKFGPGDVDRIPYHKELGDISQKERVRATYGAVYMGKELQDMQIEQTIKILNHTNPYTGLRYAEDPAIFCVELFNEDAILWNGGNWSLQRYPTLRQRMAREFSVWLLAKYGNETSWIDAWGKEAVLKDVRLLAQSGLKSIISIDQIKGVSLKSECLKQGTVVPWSYPWVYDAIVKKDNESILKLRQRLLDTAEFLIGLQNSFYSRFVQAIRDTGYQGQIVGSNWQAGGTIGHLLNLYSDYLVGIVDRHNYFGGSRRGIKIGEKFGNASMLAQPGIGTLSAGLQQVNDRPFMLSEWIHVQPNEWYAEGPAILGAYGWGLNGWDVSFMFENGDDAGFSEKIGRDAWDVTNPAIWGTFPAVARQVRRMDVAESPETQFLNVHVPSLFEGKVSFTGDTEQRHDEKTFTTDKLPPEALAALRVAVKFTDDYQETPSFDLKKYLDGNTIVSTTGQLRWTPAKNEEHSGGYFTLNTSSTKAFVGFAPGNRTFELGDGFSITPNKGFAVIYLTAKNEDQNLQSADQIVITSVARARNTGMDFNDADNVVEEKGQQPILMEPVKALISVPFRGKLRVLDQDGRKEMSVRRFNKEFAIDGAEDQTPFYLIEK
ncbi:hypothetical protein [uncultured Draconibacterium sp.]|uniref:hypothetical protein n=1 Tax=uncultured Draconibacterium sp. TaxID=1573823 RepID=UPI0029C78429|nr:hypothetical protein [uncultured Draconibacterium sp.]